MGGLAERQIDELASTLEKRIEAGDYSSLSQELNSISGEDRLAVARAMRKLNEQHRRERPELGLPNLVILELKLSGQGTVRREYFDKEQLFDMTIDKSGKVFDLYDPLAEQQRPVVVRDGFDGEKFLRELLPSFIKGRESLVKNDLAQAKSCYERAIGEADRITPAGIAKFKEEYNQIGLQLRLTDLSPEERKHWECQRNILLNLINSRSLLRRELAVVERALGNDERARRLVDEACKIDDDMYGS